MGVCENSVSDAYNYLSPLFEVTIIQYIKFSMHTNRNICNGLLERRFNLDDYEDKYAPHINISFKLVQINQKGSFFPIPL